MKENTLTEQGSVRVERILDYLKARFDAQLVQSSIYVHSEEFYPEISGAQQVEIFKYLEKQGFISLKFKKNFLDDSNNLLCEDEDWLEGLAIFTKSIHEPFDKAAEIETMKNSYTFTIGFDEGFEEKYNQFKNVDIDPNEIIYQLRARKKDCQYYLCVNDRIVSKLQEQGLPRKLLPRLLKSGNNCWVKVGDLLKDTKQSPSQILNSLMKGSELRKLFFPETTKNTIFVRYAITIEDVRTQNIDRKNIEKILKKFPRF